MRLAQGEEHHGEAGIVALIDQRRGGICAGCRHDVARVDWCRGIARVDWCRGIARLVCAG